MTLCSIADKESCRSYIKNLFGYFSNCILDFNTARMHIEWLSHPLNNVMGSSGLPDNIIIYPMQIWDKSVENKDPKYATSNDLYWFTYNIFVTVIHELFHIDQQVYYSKRYLDSPGYLYSIEKAVETNTFYYMINNMEMFKREFDFEDRTSLEKYKSIIPEIGYDKYYPYIRRNIITHLLAIFDSLCSDEDYHKFNDLSNLLISAENISVLSKVVCHENDNFTDNAVLLLKSNYQWTNLLDINRFFYDNIFRYNYRNPISFDYKLIRNRLEIEILMICKNIMTLDPTLYKN